MNVALIAAMAQNRVIGDGPRIPWRIKGEQKRFKQLTSGHCLIFGRKTYESIGRPLPHRTNIVVTRQQDYAAPGCIVVSSLSEALARCPRDHDKDQEVFVGGGAEIYREALPLATTIYLSEIHRDYPGDVFFPEFSPEEFERVSVEEVDAEVPYSFCVYRRRAPGR